MERHSKFNLLRDLLHDKKDGLCNRRRAPSRLPDAIDFLCSAIVHGYDFATAETGAVCNAA